MALLRFQPKRRQPVLRFVSSSRFLLLDVLLILLLLVGIGDAAHSRRRFVVRRDSEARYDRSITIFSEDGRLAQVEYGMEASHRGSTVAALRINKGYDKDDDDNDDNNNQGDGESGNGGDGGICLVIQNSSFGKVHRLDHHLWLVTAGLSGDARSLANMLRDGCRRMRMMYGESPTTKEVAQMAGDLQHQLTRSAGRRPLGCSAFIVGVDPSFLEVTDIDNDDENDGGGGGGSSLLGIPQLYQTDPGGIVEECTHGAAGKGRDAVLKVLSSLVTKINGSNQTKKRMPLGSSSSSNTKSKKNKTNGVLEKAAEMARQVLKELNRHAESNNNNSNDDQTVDVWIIQPHAHRRGGTKATCYRGITLDSVSRIHR